MQGLSSCNHAVLAMVSGSPEWSKLFRGERAAIAPTTSSVAELLATLAGTRARHVTVPSRPAAAAKVAEIATSAQRPARGGRADCVFSAGCNRGA